MSGRVYLNPAYQREGTIWNKSNKMAFINSVCIGSAPSRLIYNINEQGISCCLDGKQRLTTLEQFMNNEFPVKLGNEHIYYNSIIDTNGEYDNKRTYFENININIVQYKNLNYDQQLETFLRINKSISLTTGELVLTTLSESTSQLLKSLSQDNQKVIYNKILFFFQHHEKKAITNLSKNISKTVPNE